MVFQGNIIRGEFLFELSPNRISCFMDFADDRKLRTENLSVPSWSFIAQRMQCKNGRYLGSSPHLLAMVKRFPLRLRIVRLNDSYWHNSLSIIRWIKKFLKLLSQVIVQCTRYGLVLECYFEKTTSTCLYESLFYLHDYLTTDVLFIFKYVDLKSLNVPVSWTFKNYS